MAAEWLKNQPTASLRRCHMRVTNQATGQLADRGLDFTGYVYLTRDGVKSYLGLGTIVNHRRALVVADDAIESVDTGLDEVVMTAHGYETGDGPLDSNEVTGAVAAGADIYAIAVDANTVAWATSAANAYAGTRIALAGTETGATISDNADTERGIDGEFWYTATQAETNYSTSDMIVSVYGYADHESQTNVAILTSSDGDRVIEDGLTVDDIRRILVRYAAAVFSKTGNDYVYRDMADSKDSHHGTVTASGRIVAVIDDPT